MTIRAIVFDMDGTLLDSEQVYRRTFHEAAQDTGAPAADTLFLSLIGSDARTSDALLGAALGAQAQAFIAAWRDRLGPAMAGPIPLKPGAADVLGRLSGYPMAIATSTQTVEAHRRLEMAGLLGHFDHVIGGDLVERGKPAPESYRMAADRLGADPAACAAFEDSETGTRAALAAGMRVVQVPDLVPAQNPGGGQIVAATLMDGARALGLLNPEDA